MGIMHLTSACGDAESERRINDWFGNFGDGSSTEFQLGAPGLAQYLLTHRDQVGTVQCWCNCAKDLGLGIGLIAESPVLRKHNPSCVYA